MATFDIPWASTHYALREVLRVVEPWCYLCRRPVHSIRMYHDPRRMRSVFVELCCHGGQDVAELDMDPWGPNPRSIVEALREHVEQRLMAFLPEQGADMERTFNRMGAPRA